MAADNVMAAHIERFGTQAGAEPSCLMDFWAQRCLQEIDEAAAEQRQPDKHTTDLGMADTIMDFLFASQDASTASLVWMMNLMSDFPDILEKVALFALALALWPCRAENPMPACLFPVEQFSDLGL